MKEEEHLGNIEPEAIEQLYQSYLKNPQSVEESWRYFFKGFDFAQAHYPSKIQASKHIPKELDVMNLIRAYRIRGHLFTKTNPVRTRRQYTPTLALGNFNLQESDLNTEFEAGTIIGLGKATLTNIIAHLEDTYCKSVGVEYIYMSNPDVVKWLQTRMEKAKNQTHFTEKQSIEIFHELKRASGFEAYIHKRFVGQKRFSLEGSEALIPALQALIEKGAKIGAVDFVIGMAHRGRLNVLTNIMQKPYKNIFDEYIVNSYEGNIYLGDVKYHLGYNSEITTPDGKKVKLSLAPNPSHLEAVGPVVEGIAKSKLHNEYNKDNNAVVPVLIHGDAAVAGQGVVYETIQMSKLKGYETGGTIHIVINNQVGFTTSYLSGRSSTYCTDVAKVTKSPVFHVNGDDIEAVIYTIRLAMEFRQTFHTDVFLDLLSYRKYGHNESDEPRFTQPLLYDIIAKHKNPRDIYAQSLIEKGIMTTAEVEEAKQQFDASLDLELEKSKKEKSVAIQPFLAEKYTDIRDQEPQDFEKSVDTAIVPQDFERLSRVISTLPEGYPFFRKIIKLFEQRKKMLDEGQTDWAIGELLAYVSLADEGHPVRLSGQDSKRGTFSHRHAELVLSNGEKYLPLKHISKKQASCMALNSPLSEYGVLGFEYGYSLALPHGLTIWEAQFGDFHNVAQPVVDQFIASGFEKWGVKSGLVMLLPHGYEGQGAEHSSGRIERFLTLCANHNMQVANPTTPANMFHLLRRQLKRPIRLPLIIFTPKSLLRHPRCISPVADFQQGGFVEVIEDSVVLKKARKILFCSGKIYYELLEHQEQKGIQDVAIVRVEQLYPLPVQQLTTVIEKHPQAACVWVQEEPENMGAWRYIRSQKSCEHFTYIARKASGSTAEGLSELHKKNQKEIITEAFK